MDYKCVNCGAPAPALFKSYGPTVLKLTKCKKCKEIVDKYVEYDPVIVMIDLVLMSKEALRHVLYNTEFKAYWKLLIILIIMETYGVWRGESLFTMAVHSACGWQDSTLHSARLLKSPLNVSLPEWWERGCRAWAPQGRGRADETDLFIWETDFYVKFTSVAAGVFAFILTVQVGMKLMKPLCSQNYVSLLGLLRAFSVAYTHTVLALPGAVWGAEGAGAGEGEGAGAARPVPPALVAGYGAAAYASVFSVLYGCPLPVTILVLILSNISKYATSFYITPYLRSFVT